MAATFEYMTVVREHDMPLTNVDWSIQELLNDLGLAGWELVAVNTTQAVYHNKFVEVFYLKRAKPSA